MWQIAAATGWSVRRILWRVNYQALRLMLADAPRYVKRQPAAKGRKLNEFFQSKLQRDETR